MENIDFKFSRIVSEEMDFLEEIKVFEGITKKDIEDCFESLLPKNAFGFDNPLSVMVEGLTITYPIDTTIRYMQKYFGLSDNQIKKVQAANGLEHILIASPNVSHIEEGLVHAMDTCGYHLGQKRVLPFSDGKFLILQFEAKHQENIAEKLRTEETTLLHITPAYNRNSIVAIGLSPKAKNSLFNYPNRVYFLRGSTSIQRVIEIAKQLSNANQSKGNNQKYIVLRLDLERIPKETKFFFDPNYQFSVFTTENIRPEAIVDIQELDLKEI